MNRKQRMEDLLQRNFAPTELKLVDESHKHTRGLETHYKLTLVADFFKNLSRVERQQKVLALMKDEMSSGLHALSMRIMSVEESAAKASKQFESPNCQGGKK